jgi:hypothetical protein
VEADISRYKPGGGQRGSFGYDRCLIVIVFVVARASRGFGETRLHEVVLRGIRPRADRTPRWLRLRGKVPAWQPPSLQRELRSRAFVEVNRVPTRQVRH